MKCSESSCLSAKLSNRNPTWNVLGWEPEQNGERPKTNRQSNGVATNSMEVSEAGWLE